MLLSILLIREVLADPLTTMKQSTEEEDVKLHLKKFYFTLNNNSSTFLKFL